MPKPALILKEPYPFLTPEIKIQVEKILGNGCWGCQEKCEGFAAITLRTLGNGTKAVSLQCLTCGSALGPALKQSEFNLSSLDVFNNDIWERYKEERNNEA